MSLLFLTIIPLALLMLLIVHAGCRYSTVRKAWQDAAKSLRVNYRLPKDSADPGRIEGCIDHVKVSVFVKRHDDLAGRRYTSYRVHFPRSLDLKLRLYRQGLQKQLADRFATQDILFGDDGFDNAFVIQGFDKERVCDYFTTTRRAACFALLQRYPVLLVNDHEIIVETEGVVANASGIVDSVRSLVETVHLLTPERPKPEPQEPLCTSSDDTVELVETTPAPEPIAIEEIPAPKPVLKRMPKPMPEPAPAPMPKPMPEPAPAPMPEPEPVVAAPVEEPASVVLEFCNALFGETLSSADVSRRIEELKGTDIEASARLLKVQHFSYDRHFGNEAGTRAVFELCQMDRKYGSRTPIKAVVCVDDSVGEQLRACAAGEKVTFHGVFLTADALRHELYLGDGSIDHAA